MNFTCIWSSLALCLITAHCQHLPVPALPYDYDALQPFYAEETLRVHHLGHHAAYTKKLNAALEVLRADPATKYLAKLGIDTLLSRLDEIPDESVRRNVRNNGGGYVNHDLFWRSMTPASQSQEPTEGAFFEAIAAVWGDVTTFKQTFAGRATQVFGSGWTWLYLDVQTGQLGITTTANQDTPANSPTKVPLLTLDLWEHAYYLMHKNARGQWIESWWSIVDWEGTAQRLQRAVQDMRAIDQERKDEL